MLGAMNPAGFAIVVCAALALAAIAFDTEAGGRRGGGSARASSGAHRHHFHSRVFIGGGFYAWPRSYYSGPGYYYPGGYYYPPVAPLTEPQYWYYCPESAAYYPYVQDCAGGWEPVIPSAGPQG
jgi:hypothetical protein